jgi:hypothetical protein
MNYRFAACATLVWCFCIVLPVPIMEQTQPSSSGQPQSSTEQTRAVAGAQAQGVEKAQQISQYLNLSPQQESQLMPILENEAPKIQAIKNDPSLTADEKRKRLKEVHQQTDKLAKPILTPIQWKQWEQYRKNQLADIK